MMSIQVFYKGSVQGVGFRWSMRHIAKGFELTGWVRNLPAGASQPYHLTGFSLSVLRSSVSNLLRVDLATKARDF